MWNQWCVTLTIVDHLVEEIISNQIDADLFQLTNIGIETYNVKPVKPAKRMQELG